MSDSAKSLTDPVGVKTWKFRIIPTILSFLAAALIGWGESEIPADETYKILGGLLAGVVSLIPLLFIANSGDTRSARVIHYVSMAFLIIGLIVITALCIWCVNYVAYILTIGLMMLAMLSIVYFVSASGQ